MAPPQTREGGGRAPYKNRLTRPRPEGHARHRKTGLLLRAPRSARPRRDPGHGPELRLRHRQGPADREGPARRAGAGQRVLRAGVPVGRGQRVRHAHLEPLRAHLPVRVADGGVRSQDPRLLLPGRADHPARLAGLAGGWAGRLHRLDRHQLGRAVRGHAHPGRLQLPGLGALGAGLLRLAGLARAGPVPGQAGQFQPDRGPAPGPGRAGLARAQGHAAQPAGGPAANRRPRALLARRERV